MSKLKSKSITKQQSKSGKGSAAKPQRGKAGQRHASRVLLANREQPSIASSKNQQTEPASKQSRVLAMLRSPSGTTMDAMMKVTGWQQHSVRGFLAGVVRKRLELQLESQKVEDTRIYQVVDGSGSKSVARLSKQRSR